METANRSRWGVVALAIAMLVVTMVSASINGHQNSFYYAVWFFVGWYGYKGNLEQIRDWMKYLIWLNVGVVLLVLMFFEEQTVGSVIRGGNKQSMLVGVLVMLVPKIFLYLWCKEEIDKQKSISEKQTSNSLILVKQEQKKKNTDFNFELKTDPIKLKEMDEEKIWEQAYLEFESQNRKIGLWAKLFAQYDGNEIIAKSEYLKHRVKELIDEMQKIKLHENEKNKSNKEVNLLNEEELKLLNAVILEDHSTVEKYLQMGISPLIMKNGKSLIDIANENKDKEMASIILNYILKANYQKNK